MCRQMLRLYCSVLLVLKTGFASISILFLSKATPIPILFVSGHSGVPQIPFQSGNPRVFDRRLKAISLDDDSTIHLLERLRGGGSILGEVGHNDDVEHNDGSVDASDDKDDEEDENNGRTASKESSTSSSVSPSSKDTVVVTIKATTGSKILDQYPIELSTVNRNRDVASLKLSAVRQLPSKPPISSIQLTLHGKVLDDNSLVDDLVDDDDVDEDEDDTERGEDSKGLVLHLDMIPTVDPNFFFELEKTLQSAPLSDVLEAYAINEAAVLQNAMLLQHNPEKQEKPQELMSAVIRKQAERIKHDLERTVLSGDHAQSLLQVAQPSTDASAGSSSTVSHLLEIKGQRVRRMSLGSSTTTSVQGWRRVLQHNLNVDWSMTLRHFVLFLFFGLFGGRTASSRAILLLGAPSVFVLQARPVKLLIRQLAYAILDQPPSILLSLLPAPQQAILSLNMRAAMDTLYGKYIVSSVKQPEKLQTAVKENTEEDDDEYDEDEDEDAGEFDSSED